jgi:hypothetical protein
LKVHHQNENGSPGKPDRDKASCRLHLHRLCTSNSRWLFRCWWLIIVPWAPPRRIMAMTHRSQQCERLINGSIDDDLYNDRNGIELRNCLLNYLVSWVGRRPGEWQLRRSFCFREVVLECCRLLNNLDLSVIQSNPSAE